SCQIRADLLCLLALSLGEGSALDAQRAVVGLGHNDFDRILHRELAHAREAEPHALFSGDRFDLALVANFVKLDVERLLEGVRDLEHAKLACAGHDVDVPLTVTVVLLEPAGERFEQLTNLLLALALRLVLGLASFALGLLLLDHITCSACHRHHLGAEIGLLDARERALLDLARLLTVAGVAEMLAMILRPDALSGE